MLASIKKSPKRKHIKNKDAYIKAYNVVRKTKFSSVYLKSYYENTKGSNEKRYKNKKNTSYSKSNQILLKNVLYLWLDNNRARIKEATYSKYKRLIETHIIPQLGSVNIKNITSVSINKFLYEKSKNGKLDGSGALSPSYVKTISFILSSAIRFAVQEGFRDKIDINIITPQNKSKRLDVFSPKEQLVFEQYIYKNLNDKNIGMLLSLYVGLRIGEVCALKWSDIDFDEKTIHIKNTVSRISIVNKSCSQSKTKLQITNAKTVSSNRIIPIPSMLLSILFQLNKTGEFVLKGSAYPYLDPRTLQYAFHKTLKDCGLRDINFHTLRHTFATRCIESGMDVKSLSEILGHSSVNITLNTYVHSSVGLKRKQIEAMVSFCGH